MPDELTDLDRALLFVCQKMQRRTMAMMDKPRDVVACANAQNELQRACQLYNDEVLRSKAESTSVQTDANPTR